MDSRSYFLVVLLFLLISAVGLFLTCGVECFVALFFGFSRYYNRLILVTNLISQVVMRLLQILLLWLLFISELSLGYYWLVLLLEIPVYACEFLVYKKHIWEASWQRCLLYTICANTASALLGLCMLNFIL